MFDPCTNPAFLAALHAHALGRAYLRERDDRRQATGRQQTDFYERVWREAADRLGATFEVLGSGIAEVRRGGARVRVFANASPIDDPVTLAVARDKPLTYRLLRGQGLPVPRHARFSLKSFGDAVAFLQKTGGDCVVKPATGDRNGRGITTGLRTRFQVARAAAAASVDSEDLLIEEQIEGENYRLLYLDGRLIDACCRRPPSVVADGRSTVAELVFQANEARRRYGSGLSRVLLTIDLDMSRTLAKQGLTPRSVPVEGAEVLLKTVVNENCGADNTTATHRLCAEVIEAGARAARATGVRLAGVDLITVDPDRPLEESGGAVLDVNTPPDFYFHYRKRDGAFPVAVHVLERLLAPPADRLVFTRSSGRAFSQEAP
ncbi:MAG: hypothetical protein AB7I30_03305 [Isosphaeraceae bacterium]